MSPVTPPLLPLPQSSAELYWDLLSRSKALPTLSFSGIWLPLEKSCAAKPSFSLGQSLKGNRCEPELQARDRGLCLGREEVSLSVQHKANLGNSWLLVLLSQKSRAGLSSVQVSVPEAEACIRQ